MNLLPDTNTKFFIGSLGCNAKEVEKRTREDTSLLLRFTTYHGVCLAAASLQVGEAK